MPASRTSPQPATAAGRRKHTLEWLLAIACSLAPALALTAPAPAPAPGPASAPSAAPVAATANSITPLGQPPDWNQLLRYARLFTQEEFRRCLEDLYLEKTRFPVPWVIGPDAVVIQTGQPETPEVRIPFIRRGETPAPAPSRYWRQPAEFPPLNERPPLSDVHIAIDPGHIGGPYAVMEERFLSFQPGESIQEGDLTLLTARILEQRLKDLGAYVTLVRQQPAPVTTKTPADFRLPALETLRQAGFDKPVDSYTGITGEARLLTIQWQSEKLFYRIAEIHARAARVNQEIKPDLALCLHFNAESWGKATEPQPSPVNHLHLLVNGCYSPAELAHQDTRFEMLTRLFNRVHEEEIAVARLLAESLARSTGLPPYRYQTPNAREIPGSPYLYARNLLANRLYQCPTVYFEPFVMNHMETYQRLRRGHWVGRTLIGDTLVTSAIEDYVQGIVDGLVAHYSAHRPS